MPQPYNPNEDIKVGDRVLYRRTPDSVWLVGRKTLRDEYETVAYNSDTFHLFGTCDSLDTVRKGCHDIREEDIVLYQKGSSPWVLSVCKGRYLKFWRRVVRLMPETKHLWNTQEEPPYPKFLPDTIPDQPSTHPLQQMVTEFTAFLKEVLGEENTRTYVQGCMAAMKETVKTVKEKSHE